MERIDRARERDGQCVDIASRRIPSRRILTVFFHRNSSRRGTAFFFEAAMSVESARDVNIFLKHLKLNTEGGTTISRISRLVSDGYDFFFVQLANCSRVERYFFSFEKIPRRKINPGISK